MKPDRVDSKLALEILQYYLRHPEAADTLEGVARWRLLEQRIHHTVEEVRKALSWLIDLGLLQETVRAGSPTLIRLNRDRMEEARRLLTGESAEASDPSSGNETAEGGG